MELLYCRIVARKPKDVWAVRLAIGTYLLDGRHFKPLDIEEWGPMIKKCGILHVYDAHVDYVYNGTILWIFIII